MSSQPVEQLTLREKLKTAEQVCRELADHLERGFAPKTKALKALLKSDDGIAGAAEVTDRTIRHSVEAVLDSDKFARKITERLQALIAGIDESVNQIVAG